MQGRINFVQFWLDDADTAEADYRLWVACRVSEEAARSDAGAAIGRPWLGANLRTRRPYWWNREEPNPRGREPEEPGAGFGLVTYDLCCYGGAVVGPSERGEGHPSPFGLSGTEPTSHGPGEADYVPDPTAPASDGV